MYPNTYCNNIYNSRDMEATWTSSDRGMGKDDVILLSPHTDIQWNIQFSSVAQSCKTL